MAGVAGAKNSYKTGVLIGNWNEDTWGAALVNDLAQARPQLETSEYKSTFSGEFGPASRPALRGFDALDGRLVMAHGTKIVAPSDPSERFLTVAAATGRGIPVASVLHGAAASRSLDRTDAVRVLSTKAAAGVDAWDPPSEALPKIPMTVTPRVPLASDAVTTAASATQVRGATGRDAFKTVSNTMLGSAATLRETVKRSTFGVDESHGRSFGFTGSFQRGVSACGNDEHDKLQFPGFAGESAACTARPVLTPVVGLHVFDLRATVFPV